MAEGSETPGEPPRSTDRDLLAERRARRAIDSDPTPTHPTQPTSAHPTEALTRRAEVAEATVQTLETHLASLQQRVREAAEERVIFSERLDCEQAAVAEREHELRRVKQREYAEQQLRVEAEDRRTHLERDSRAEIDRLTRRLSASEHHARELAERLEGVQRELAEAEQAAAAEHATVRRGERDLQMRLAELERRAQEIRREIDSERAARERAEYLLQGMREGYRRVERLVAELKGIAVQLRAGAGPQPVRERVAVQSQPAVRREHGEAHRDEMADALAAAVERLRARVADVGDDPVLADRAVAVDDGQQEELRTPPSWQHDVATPPIVDAQQGRLSHPAERSPHKHSMSLLTRIRRRRKQRRERRSAAAQPPTMQSK
jgi:DNA repair exonuclease SbcCD ATPase subunit